MSSLQSDLPVPFPSLPRADVQRENRAGTAVLIALGLLVANYLSFNLFGIGGSVLIISRGAVIFLLALSFAKTPTVNTRVIYLLLSCLAGAILGGIENNIAQNLTFIVIVIGCLRHVNLDSIVDRSLVVFLFAMGLIFALLTLGLTENGIDTADGRNRASFGFSNVNAFTSLVYAFITLALYRWRGQNVVKYVLFTILSYVVYLYTDSRTLVASILLFFFAHVLYAVLPKGMLKVMALLLLLLPLMLTQMSGYIAETWPLVDIALSFRPSYSAVFIEGFSAYNYLLGGQSPAAGQTIDNSFLLIQGAVGLPFLLALTWVAYRKIVESISRNRPEVFCLILSFWYFSYSESSMVRPESIIGVVFWLLLSVKISESTRSV